MIACLFVFATAATAHAAPLQYVFNGPAFTVVDGPYTSDSKITGKLAFDSAFLDSSGSGFLDTRSGAILDGFAWSFEDGYNRFDNEITKDRFTIQVGFTNFAVSSWNIDTTHGWTANDMFVSDWANISVFNGAQAYGPTASAANWTQVPEPGSLALLGLGMAGLAALRRRRVAG